MVEIKDTDHTIIMTARAYEELCESLNGLVWCDTCGLLMSENEPDQYNYQGPESDLICIRCNDK